LDSAWAPRLIEPGDCPTTRDDGEICGVDLNLKASFLLRDRIFFMMFGRAA
jgi:hypothetical protein